MTDYRPPYRAGALAGGLVFLLYVLTLSPSTAWWDASEYIATGHILGIPHPPGNAFFVVLAKTWSLLLAPLGLPVAVRINLLAAATSALSSFFFFLVIHRIVSEVLEEEWMAKVGAGAGTLIGATAYTVWNQSTVNEKVYTVSVLAIAAVSWLAMVWYDRRDDDTGTRALLGAMYVMVLGATNHLMSILALPALGLFVLLVKPSAAFSKAFLLRVIPMAIIGISFNLFLPIRSAQRPVINEGNPVCESFTAAATSVFTNGMSKACEPLALSLTRDQYQKPPMTQRMAPMGHQFMNYFQWFDWQWARGLDLAAQPFGSRLPATMLFMALGFMGFMVMWRADRNIFFYMAGLAATLTVGLVVYLNFKYGYSLSGDNIAFSAREVRERDYFFVASFMVWGAIAGIGLAGFWGALAEQLGGSAKKAAPVLLVAFIPLIFNWSWASRSGDYAARDWAFDLLMSVEPYGILFTNGDNDTFPLWYAQEVEGVRKDVTVIVVQYLYTEWYLGQLQELTVPERQRPFDPEFASGIYEVPESVPSASISSLTAEQAATVFGGSLPESFQVPIGPVAVEYPAGTAFDRAQTLAVRIITDSFGERPIFFASTGGLIQELGLGPWGVRYGLTTKLVMRNLNDPLESADYTMGSVDLSPEWWDVDRNLKLVEDVYMYRGLRDREIWQDNSTTNIPLHYQFLFTQLADAALNAGMDEDLVTGLAEKARAFRITAAGGLKFVLD
jgi:transmembrane protein TMEM260 (protein O-mannosyltransferase)